MSRAIADGITLAEQGKWDELVSQYVNIHSQRVASEAAVEHTPLSQQRVHEIVRQKASGRCYKAATTLLTEEACPELCPATAHSCEQLFVTPLTPKVKIEEHVAALNKAKHATRPPLSRRNRCCPGSYRYAVLPSLG